MTATALNVGQALFKPQDSQVHLEGQGRAPQTPNDLHLGVKSVAR